MDLRLVLDLAHAVSALVWAAGGAVLLLILVAAARDGAAARRALPEARLIGRAVLGPAGVAAVATASLLGPGGAWLLGALALVAGAAALRAAALAPAFARAARRPGEGGRALGLVALDLAAQGGAAVLLVARPDWQGLALLAGLGVCAALAVALGRSFEGTAAA